MAPDDTSRPPNVVVTGAGGLVGAAAVAALAKAGCEVTGIVRSAASPRAEVPGVTWEEADLFSPGAVRAIFERHRPTHLLALAWTMKPGYQGSLDNFHWLRASLGHLEDFATSGGGRVVFCGSCMEYDWSGQGTLSETTTPLRPSTAYGAAKASLFTAFGPLCDVLGLSGAWARPFFLYGPGENERRLVADVILSLLAGREALCSHGRQRRDFLHVDDLGEALASLLVSPVEGPVNIGSGEAVAIADLVQQIGRQIGRPDLIRLGAREAPPDDPPLVEADVSRLTRELGWRPEIGLQDGLAHTIAWWRERQNREGA